MNNPKSEENISGNRSAVIESQNSICENDQIDDQYKLKIHPVKNLTETYPRDNSTAISNRVNDRPSFNIQEQCNVMNNFEQNSQRLSGMEMCTESSTDNEQTSAIKEFDKDVNKNMEILNDSGITASFVVSKNLHSTGDIVCTTSNCTNESVLKNNQEEAIVADSCEPNLELPSIMDTGTDASVCSTLDIDVNKNTKTQDKSNSEEVNNLKSLSENRNIGTENACAINVNPIPNNFEMVSEDTLLGLSSSDRNTNKSTDCTLTSTDNSIVISNSNAVPQSDSIVSSNYSLSQLRAYGSDESLNDECPDPDTTAYRVTSNEVDLCDKDSDSDSSSTSSSSSIFVSDSSDSESECELGNAMSVTRKPIKAKGELDLSDLPPIEDLKISVPGEDCTPVGQVYKIVDQLVVIQAIKDSPALNLDTVLFTQEGKPIGKIFDVFGPVAEPLYCVRFNSNDQIKEKNISLNQTIYCAPNTKYTNYVFLAQLLKLKGSDASWENDLEPPVEYLDYSDDEQERLVKKKGSRNKKSTASTQPVDPDEPARKRHSSYERRMNKRNLLLSSAAGKKAEINKLINSIWPPSSAPAEYAAHSYCTSDGPHSSFGSPPVFTGHDAGYFPPRNMFPPRPNMFPSRPDTFPPRPYMFPPRPDMFSPRPNMFPPRPDMFPTTPNIFSPKPDMFPPRPNMFPPKPNMFPSRLDMPPPRPDNHLPDMHPPSPDMHSPRSDMFSPRPDMYSPRPDMHPPRPDIFSPRPDMYSPRPDMYSPRPDMYSPRPDMHPPRSNMYSPRSDMYSHRPDMYSTRPDMHPPRPEMFPSQFHMFPRRPDMLLRPSIFPPRMIAQEQSNFIVPKNVVNPPLNAFQPPPPGYSNPNTSSHPSQPLQPRMSPAPMSPLGPSVHESQSLRNPYPNQPQTPPPPPSFWQSPHQNSPTPRPNPF